MRIRILLLALTASIGTADAAGVRHDVVRPRAAVQLSPGDDIQAAVDAHPPGTSFFLAAGVYRIQSVTTKTGDSFIGDGGAVLDGARLLTEFGRAGNNWVAVDLPIDPNTQVHGVCRRGYPRCDHPQDLYFDGVPLRAVNEYSKVAPGKWYYDYQGEAVYFADDPTGHTVELSYRPFAIAGKARSVTVENLIVEKYANVDQQGAIGDMGEGRGWAVTNNEVRWNHGVGVAVSEGAVTKGNFIHHNGELGFGSGKGSGELSDNEIAFNVWNGTDCAWECGGAKWAEVTEWFVLGNYVHDNQGDGLWADIDSEQMLFKNNRIENNLLAGLSIEISSHAIVDQNSFSGNGATAFQWGWDGQVQIQNSWGVEVEDNTFVLDPAHGGNGVIVIQQKRGARNMPRDNNVHDNDFTMTGGEGALAGWFADYKPDAFASTNTFDNNHYHVYAPDGAFWSANEAVDFAQWQESGQDVHSTLDQAPPRARRR
jgi:Right handed beta helix region